MTNMTKAIRAALLAAPVLATAAVLSALSPFAAPADAHDYKTDTITIDHPWARPSLGRVPNSAAYATIMNTGAKDDRLVSAATDAAEKVELHTHINDNGIMRMREVDGGIVVPAGETVKLAPGGLHIMLIGLTRKLNAGETLPMTLTFEKAGTMDVVAIIEMGGPKMGEDGARGSMSGADGHTMHRGSASGTDAATN